MNKEKLEKSLAAIRGNGDEALTSVDYLSIIDGFDELKKIIAEKSAEIETLIDENKRLREINSQIQLDYASKIVEEKKDDIEKLESVEEIEISDEDFKDAINNLI